LGEYSRILETGFDSNSNSLWRIQISVLEFEFGEFSRHFQNSKWASIREFEYEFELGEFFPTPGISPESNGRRQIVDNQSICLPLFDSEKVTEVVSSRTRPMRRKAGKAERSESQLERLSRGGEAHCHEAISELDHAVDDATKRFPSMFDMTMGRCISGFLEHL
jgi:hypothetical protein